MTLNLYLSCFGIALIGMALQVVLKIKSFQDKATAANVCFVPADFFKKDYWALIASVLTIFLFIFLLGDLLKMWPDLKGWVKIGFAFVGYTGSDIASRLFSVLNGKLNSIIDQKTNQADGGSQNVTPLK